MTQSLRELLRSVSRRERVVVALVSVAIMAVTSIPALFGWAHGLATGREFTGLQALSPGDLAVYLSYIDQGKRGAVLFENTFTTEFSPPALNVLWFGVGLLARTFDLSALAAYHVARVALIPAFAAAAYALCAFFFHEARHRLSAFFLFMTASGVGALLGRWFSGEGSARGTFERPIDLWVGEANAFLSSGYSPHFVASWALFLAAMLLFLFALERRRQSHAIAAGVAGALLFQFHPFHAPTLLAVFAGFLAWHGARRTLAFSHVISLAIFAASAAPMVAYHYILSHTDAAAASLLDANVTLTPSVAHIVFGFGAFAFLAPIGYLLSRRGEWRQWSTERGYLAVWAVVQFAMAYAPLTFQRRLLEGLQFPLVALSVPAFAYAWQRLSKFPFLVPLAAVPAALLLFFSSFHNVAANVGFYRTNSPPIFYFSVAESDALRWLRAATPQDAVFFSGFETGNMVGGWADRRVYAGHWVNTAHITVKQQRVAWFFTAATARERQEFFSANGISHVIIGRSEKTRGWDAVDLGVPPAFSNDDVQVYAVGAIHP